MKLVGKNILVVGLGRSGMAAARFLRKARASVVVTDCADENRLGNCIQEIKKLGIEAELGGHRVATFERSDLIVISPGVSHTIAPIARARKKGIPVIGEIELAARFIREPIVAVTGTNGKTTTSELIGAMLTCSGRTVFVGGNIGNPLIEYVEKAESADVVVAEISSFQLDTIDTFKPKVGVLLNIGSDHLDRYPNGTAYARAKLRLFENQQAADIAVLNGADPLIQSLTQRIKSQKLIYPAPQDSENGAMLDNSRIILKTTEPLAFTSQIQNGQFVDTAEAGFVGRHNRENACAATLAALAAGANVEGIQTALNNFHAAAHRLEYIGSIKDVQYINDSKATNVDAVIRALECFSKPVLLIMGGRDKGADFGRLRHAVRSHVKALIVMGEAANRITSVLQRVVAVTPAYSMREAVQKAFDAAAPGDVVLLSPGCASFDMYANYAHRGDDFRQAVKSLA